jgi:hypothetical protein
LVTINADLLAFIKGQGSQACDVPGPPPRYGSAGADVSGCRWIKDDILRLAQLLRVLAAADRS